MILTTLNGFERLSRVEAVLTSKGVQGVDETLVRSAIYLGRRANHTRDRPVLMALFVPTPLV